MNEYNTEIPTMKGEVEITFFNRQTGEIIDSEKDSNIVVQYGYKNLLRGISNKADGVNNIFAVDNIKLGTDVGNGTTENPEDPDITYTDANQEFNYNGLLDSVDGQPITGEEVSKFSDISINYDVNRPYSVTFGVITNGDALLNNFFEPNVIEFTFTSLGLYTKSTDYPIIAYKRFPAKTITRIVDVDISWTLYFDI